MPQELVLYDLPSPEPCHSWSGNVWKTRLALNYKGIPYKTEWLLYIHLQDTLKSFGIKPNPPGSWSDYSLPTVRFPDDSIVMDSAKIASELESRYPTPSLRLNPDLEKEVGAAVGMIFMAVAPYFFYCAPNFVAPADLQWFKEDRSRRFHTTIEKAFETKKDPAPFFEAAKPGFAKLKEVLTKHKVDEGPFILGSKPCYADFTPVASIHMFSLAGEEAYTSFRNAAPKELLELYEASKQWTERDN